MISPKFIIGLLSFAIILGIAFVSEELYAPWLEAKTACAAEQAISGERNIPWIQRQLESIYLRAKDYSLGKWMNTATLGYGKDKLEGITLEDPSKCKAPILQRVNRLGLNAAFERLQNLEIKPPSAWAFVCVVFVQIIFLLLWKLLDRQEIQKSGAEIESLKEQSGIRRREIQKLSNEHKNLLEQYNKLSEIKSNQDSELLQLNTLYEENRKLQDAARDLEIDTQSKSNEVLELSHQNKILTHSVEEKDQEIETLRRHLSTLEKSLKKISNENLEMKEALKNSESEKEVITDQFHTILKEKEKLLADLEMASDEKKSLLHSLEMKIEDIETIQLESCEMQNSLKKLNTENLELKEGIKKSQNEGNAWTKKFDILSEENKQTEYQLIETRSELQQKLNELNHLSTQHKETVVLYDNAERDLDSKQKDLQNMVNRFEEADSQLKVTTAKVMSLEEQIKCMNATNENLRQALSEESNAQKELMKENLELKEKLIKSNQELECGEQKLLTPSEELQIKIRQHPSISGHNSERKSVQPIQPLTELQISDLSQQIWDIYNEKGQSQETLRKKFFLRDKLSRALEEADMRGFRLFIVGSSLTGFATENSDVDMCLIINSVEVSQDEGALKILQSVMEILNRCQFVKDVEIIQAKIPILRFKDSESNIEVDLNINHTDGVRNTHLLAAYAQMDWRVKPLTMVVKLWAKHHNINSAKDKTISSYSLVLMIIHYLQYGVKSPVVPCLHKLYPEKFNPRINLFNKNIGEELPAFGNYNRDPLGQLFLGFLNYFANSFDFSDCAISIRTGSILPKNVCRNWRTAKNFPRMWQYLCIEEPYTRTNTASAVYDKDTFERVKLAFEESCQLLAKTGDLTSIM